MAKKLIVANWKMHPETLKEAKQLFSEVKKSAAKLRRVTTIICPPAVFLYSLSNGKGQVEKVYVGAQNCFHEKKGSHTGQLSPEMIAKTGARYLLLGHSEARAQGETNAQIARKIVYALDAGMRPILCIGERVRDEHGFYLKYIEEQLNECLAHVSKKRIELLTFAYEPIWAISSEMLRPATPEESHEMVLYVRKLLSLKIGIAAAKAVPILYGGSVDAKNCEQFLQHGGCDGFLVGHASLNAKEFTQILKTAEVTKAMLESA